MRKKLKKEVVNGNAYAKGYMGLTPTKEGYTFKGWSYKGKVYTPPYTESTFGPITGDADISAVWERNTSDTVYTIENVYPLTIPTYSTSNPKMIMGDFDTTIRAEFYKKTGNNPKERCECYCCIYKVSSLTGKQELVYQANNGQPTSYLRFNEFFDCNNAISYIIYIGSSAMPDPNSTGNKNISAYRELDAMYYDIVFEKPATSTSKTININEGDDLPFKAQFKCKKWGDSSYRDCKVYASLVRSGNELQEIYSTNTRENEFNYTVKNIRNGTYVKGYKLFINPFEKVKLDNYVRQEGFNVSVTPNPTEYYILVENKRQSIDIEVEENSIYTITAEFYKKPKNGSATLCECYAAIGRRTSTEGWGEQLEWKSTGKVTSIEQPVEITSDTNLFGIFINPDEPCTYGNFEGDFDINVKIKYNVAWKDGDFPQ